MSDAAPWTTTGTGCLAQGQGPSADGIPVAGDQGLGCPAGPPANQEQRGAAERAGTAAALAAPALSRSDGAGTNPTAEPPRRLRLATVWLAGCSGCHMSFLDLDEFLFELAERVEVVFSPVASDVKLFPEGVDVCLVEGAVANGDNLEMALQLRARSAVVVSFGDCAITANVPGLRNLITPGGRASAEAALRRSYLELADAQAQIPAEAGVVPPLLPQVLPLHAVIPVEVYLPGCPPSAARIRTCLEALLRGERPRLEGPELLRFG